MNVDKVASMSDNSFSEFIRGLCAAEVKKILKCLKVNKDVSHQKITCCYMELRRRCK